MENKIKSISIVFILLLVSSSYIQSANSTEVTVPPTNAYSSIKTDNGTLKANTYHDNLNFTGENGITVLGNNKTESILISGKTSPIVSNVSLLNQSSVNGSSDLLYTPTISGVYRVSVYQEPQTPGSSGTISTSIIWTDQSGQTRGLTPAPDTSLNGANHFGQGSIYINVQGTTNIDYQTTITNPTGNPTYNLFITVEKLS